jgi:hypothetical protein
VINGGPAVALAMPNAKIKTVPIKSRKPFTPVEF